jgi:transcriptional regulator NrdR family protein
MAELLERKKWDPAADKRGLECSKCGCRHFEVVYTRPKTAQIVRLRECRHCGKRVLTRERVDE